MSIIEKAAQRLEQLRRAGVEAPPPVADPVSELANANTVTERTGAHERAPALQPIHLADTAVITPAPSAAPAAKTPRPADPARRSKAVEIDLTALAAGGYITPEAQRSQVADEFRVLKRPIIKNAQGGAGLTVARGNCVMVTSALPNEGKSFVALNLAMSIASEVDSTVLLVDADVANPNLMKRMHLPATNGLLDLLTNKSMELADVLLRTNVEKLSLLPAGSAHRRATEMLASSAMAELVEQMATRYPDRILVFDSPPLLATTEARVLASHMGQIVMVVEADETTQVEVMQALETIEHCPIVLMVLNKISHTEVGGYYGYGVYGGYGATT
jgi:receptor protein-tyrosine kinase